MIIYFNPEENVTTHCTCTVQCPPSRVHLGSAYKSPPCVRIQYERSRIWTALSLNEESYHQRRSAFFTNLLDITEYLAHPVRLITSCTCLS